MLLKILIICFVIFVQHVSTYLYYMKTLYVNDVKCLFSASSLTKKSTFVNLLLVLALRQREC